MVNQKQMLSRPERLLREVIRDFPRAPEAVNLFRSMLREPDGLRWPEWCFIPMSAWNAVAMQFGTDFSVSGLSMTMNRLHHLMGWRYSKGIYRFDSTIFSLLISSPPVGDLPAEVFKRLPEWTIYIETPESLPDLPGLHGFFVSLEYEISERNPEHPEELRLLLDYEDGLFPVAMGLGDWSVEESITMFLNENGTSPEFNARVGLKLARHIRPLLSLVLWICSDAPEIDSDRVPGISPTRPGEKKTKRGWRLFPAEHERLWTVGGQTGEQLRRATENHVTGVPTGRHVVTHLRRGHWHGYWTGPRNIPAERRFVYRFLHPILVNPQ